MLTSRSLSDKILIVPSERAAKKPTTKYGGIAQLGERLNGIQEVSGSIPLISTNQTGKVRRDFGSEKWQKRKVSVTFSLF